MILNWLREALPNKSNPPVPSCANCHANSTRVQVCARCSSLPKGQGRGTWAQMPHHRAGRPPSSFAGELVAVEPCHSMGWRHLHQGQRVSAEENMWLTDHWRPLRGIASALVPGGSMIPHFTNTLAIPSSSQVVSLPSFALSWFLCLSQKALPAFDIRSDPECEGSQYINRDCLLNVVMAQKTLCKRWGC